MNDKKAVRDKLKETLSEIPRPIYEDNSYKIAKKLYEQPEWMNAKVIGITISRIPEVDTYQIIRKAWELGKIVAVPKCYPKEKKLSFRIITEFSQLESVFWGLLEPIEEKTKEVISCEIDLLLVPGLAYTSKGYRLGFGGGYYDRFLTTYNGNTLSLAFDMQVLPEFPIEVHDIPVAKIITNNEIIKTND